jgi:dolichyl-phosphate beta-glucosyltransferase
MELELTVIVPAFNEAHRLQEGMKRFEAAVADGAVDLERTEVVVVDDGSTDETAATARSLLAALPHHDVLSHPKNRGKGAAVRTGVARARGTMVAYMDADMAIDPRAIPLLMTGLSRHDLAIGSRALADSMVESTYALRSVMGGLFNELVTTGTGLGLRDTQCGFKGFHTTVARLLFHLVQIDRFAFDVELLSQARRLGLTITEVPVQWKHVAGSSVHPIHDSITMLGDVLRSRIGLLPYPPVPSAVVTSPKGTSGSSPSSPRTERGQDLVGKVSSVVAGTLDVPTPLLETADGVMVLLPLVHPADVAAVLSGLHAEFGSDAVTRKPMTVDSLIALGPLAGRLTC